MLLYHLLEVNQGVWYDVPLFKPEDNQKYTTILFSHSVAQTSTFFSALMKQLVGMGFIVMSIEHKDQSALHTINSAGRSKYFKNINIKDSGQIQVSLSLRHIEMEALLENQSKLLNEIKNYQEDMLET